ncbi:MAG: head maturation protease, ClpP-related [Schlesneria sp.]
MTKPIILRNAAADTPELWFYSEFGSDNYGYGDCISANAVKDALSQIGQPRKMNVMINSAGGDVFEASAVYNMLKNYPAKKNVMIHGLAASCASWVAQVGDTITMAENGLMMIHDPETMSYGNQEQLTRDAAMLGQVKSTILGIYSARSTKCSAQRFSDAMSAETWYTANDALDVGLIDSIDPNKTITCSFDPRRFRNAPSWIKERAIPVDDWKKIINERRQQLNEAEAG